MRHVFFFALAALCAVALPAHAQELWRYNPDYNGEVQALNCPLNDGETGNYLCLILGCEQGGPLQWRVAMAGGDLPDRLWVDLLVDGEAAGFLDMNRIESDIPFDFVTPYDGPSHNALVEALKTGGRAEIALEGYSDTIRYPMSLSGSSAAISMAMRACPVGPAAITDPVAYETGEAVSLCADMGGTIGVEAGFETWMDLDGDGREDVVINLGAAVCTQAASLYCGSGGCGHALYLARDGGYVRVWYDTMHELHNEPGPTATLMMHGSACDEAGVVPCALRLDLSGDEAQVMERIVGDAALEWRDTLERETAAPPQITPETPAQTPAESTGVTPAPNPGAERGFTRDNGNK